MELYDLVSLLVNQGLIPPLAVEVHYKAPRSSHFYPLDLADAPYRAKNRPRMRGVRLWIIYPI